METVSEVEAHLFRVVGPIDSQQEFAVFEYARLKQIDDPGALTGLVLGGDAVFEIE